MQQHLSNWARASLSLAESIRMGQIPGSAEDENSLSLIGKRMAEIKEIEQLQNSYLIKDNLSLVKLG